MASAYLRPFLNRNNSLEKNLGYSDSELQKLSKNRPYRNGYSIWATWESERTSFGKTFRKMVKYPRFLPLFFSSDHYVDVMTSFRNNEANPTYPLYLTWNEEKCLKLRKKHNVKSIHVQHPWIAYRRKKFSERNPDAMGTIIFWPHSSAHLNVSLNLEKAKAILDEVPDKYKPVSICLSAYDIQIGLVEKIRSIGFPIYTVGNVHDQRFVDRFYHLVNKFKFAGGFFTGSHVYYCHEFGVPYLALDSSIVTMTSIGSDVIEDGDFDLLAKDYPDAAQRSVFDDWYSQMREYSDEVSGSQLIFAQNQLGCTSSTSIWTIRRYVYYALLTNIYRIPQLYLAYFYMGIKKLLKFECGCSMRNLATRFHNGKLTEDRDYAKRN